MRNIISLLKPTWHLLNVIDVVISTFIFISKYNVLRDFDPCGFIYVVSYLNCYIFRKVYTTDVLFSPLYTTPFLYVQIYYDVLHKHGADVKVQYLMWFKTATSSGRRSLQIVSNLECM